MVLNKTRKFSGPSSMRFIHYAYASNVKKNGAAPVYLLVHFPGSGKVKLNSGVEVEIGKWNADKQRVKGASSKSNDQNLILQNFMAKATRVVTDYRLAQLPLTKEAFKREMENPSDRLDFIQFWEREAEHRRKSGVVVLSSYQTELQSLTRLKKYVSHLNFNDISPEFLEAFEGFLRKNMKLQASTTHKTIKHFKTYFRKAGVRGIKTADPFKHYTMPKPETSKIVWLRKEELYRLRELHASSFLNSTQRHVLSAFLFAAHTGLRKSDWNKVTPENFNENGFLVFVPHKTRRHSKQLRIPVPDLARQYLNEKAPLLDLYSDQATNRTLKEIARICDIKKQVTTHVARHTFASLFIQSGGNVVALQKILGHSKIEDTMIYVHLHTKDLETEMQVFNRFIE